MDALSPGMPPLPTAGAGAGLPAGALLPGMAMGAPPEAGGAPPMSPDAGMGMPPPGMPPPGMPSPGTPMPPGSPSDGGMPPAPGGGIAPIQGPDGTQGVFVPQDLFFKLMGSLLQQAPEPSMMPGMGGGPPMGPPMDMGGANGPPPAKSGPGGEKKKSPAAPEKKPEKT